MASGITPRLEALGSGLIGDAQMLKRLSIRQLEVV